MTWQYAFFFFGQREFYLPLLRHTELAQLGADKACEDGELGSSRHLPARVPLSDWFGKALLAMLCHTSLGL